MSVKKFIIRVYRPERMSVKQEFTARSAEEARQIAWVYIRTMCQLTGVYPSECRWFLDEVKEVHCGK